MMVLPISLRLFKTFRNMKWILTFPLFLSLNLTAQIVPFSFIKKLDSELITDGLILHLNASNSSSYSGTGATWNDISGQVNTATLVNSPTFNSSPASFSFSSAKYATTTKNNISLSSATFIAWINPSQTQGGYTGIIFNRTGSGGSTARATGMDLYSSNSVGYTWDNVVETYNWNSGLFVPNNQWSMIAITINSTSATAYLCNANGISSATNAVANASLSNLNFFIATDPVNTAERSFIGRLTTAMVYNRALSQAEITSNFNFQKSTFGL
jgi:hypothetical protein